MLPVVGTVSWTVPEVDTVSWTVPDMSTVSWTVPEVNTVSWLSLQWTLLAGLSLWWTLVVILLSSVKSPYSKYPSFLGDYYLSVDAFWRAKRDALDISWRREAMGAKLWQQDTPFKSKLWAYLLTNWKWLMSRPSWSLQSSPGQLKG